MLHCRHKIIFKKQHGFVLLLMLVFLYLFSMLGLFELTAVITRMKANQHSWQRKINLMTAEQVLQNLESNIAAGDTRCLIDIIPMTELTQQPLEWWQQNACQEVITGIRYYHVVELIDQDNCAKIGKTNNNHNLGANFYRITLYLPNPYIFLQTTIATSSDTELSCQSPIRIITAGRQMSREL